MGELECLESIYADAYAYEERTKIFTVQLQAEEDSDDREQRQQVEFDIPPLANFGVLASFKHPKDYPQVGIEYTLEHIEFQEDDDESDDEAHISKEKLPDPFWFPDLKEAVNEIIEENLDMIHVFQVCTEIQEKLTELCEKFNTERSDKIAQLK